MRNDFMKHCQFKVVDVSDNFIVLKDEGPHDVYPTITNDVEWLVKYLASKEYLRGRRLYYYDSEGDFAEILYEGKIYGEGYIFTGFRPAKHVELVP